MKLSGLKTFHRSLRGDDRMIDLSAVFAIAYEGVSKMCHLYANLMMSACVKVNFDKGGSVIHFNGAVVQSGKFRSGSCICTDRGTVCAGRF